jgi:hypothetical protein
MTLCVASQRVIPKVSIYFIVDSYRKLLDTPSYTVRKNTSSVTLQWGGCCRSERREDLHMIMSRHQNAGQKCLFDYC